jgi:poly(3-hydroxybutyrate) depolymerase
LVVQPEAPGGLAWSTNSGGDYEQSSDASFVRAILEQLAAGTFGPADMAHVYATGISSGGYMTSRMAVSHAGKFRALAIQSGSYATCLGPLCNIPAQLPPDHPPTLFLHGTVDVTVGIGTARAYDDKLKQQGIQTKFVEDPNVGHAWLAVAPNEITRWFQAHAQ